MTRIDGALRCSCAGRAPRANGRCPGRHCSLSRARAPRRLRLRRRWRHAPQKRASPVLQPRDCLNPTSSPCPGAPSVHASRTCDRASHTHTHTHTYTHTHPRQWAVLRLVGKFLGQLTGLAYLMRRRVLGEPKSANAPHASVCAVSSNTKCEDRYKFSKKYSLQ